MFSGARDCIVYDGNFYSVGRDLYMAPQGENAINSFRGSDDNIFMC
jgi:hypothetical protein